MQKLNICLVSLTIAPDSHDGAGKSFRGVFDYLRNQGHNVKLITGKWNTYLNDPDIIQFDLIPKRFLWAPIFMLKAIRYLRTHEFDIIHGRWLYSNYGSDSEGKEHDVLPSRGYCMF